MLLARVIMQIPVEDPELALEQILLREIHTSPVEFATERAVVCRALTRFVVADEVLVDEQENVRNPAVGQTPVELPVERAANVLARIMLACPVEALLLIETHRLAILHLTIPLDPAIETAVNERLRTSPAMPVEVSLLTNAWNPTVVRVQIPRELASDIAVNARLRVIEAMPELVPVELHVSA